MAHGNQPTTWAGWDADMVEMQLIRNLGPDDVAAEAAVNAGIHP